MIPQVFEEESSYINEKPCHTFGREDNLKGYLSALVICQIQHKVALNFNAGNIT